MHWSYVSLAQPIEIFFTSSSNSSSKKTMTHLSDIANNIAVDDLVTQGAWTSGTMLLT